ncbi:MAG: GNAT family N-acetyltransferase [Pseudomonadota bacterium]
MLEIRAVADDDKLAHEDLAKRIDGILETYAETHRRPFDNRYVSFEAKEDGAMIGGIHAYVLYGWCFIKLLAIEPGHRGKGLGETLMQQLEERMRAEGVIGLWVDTYEYQAPGFYERLGFTRYGTLEAAEPICNRHYLYKRLTATP